MFVLDLVGSPKDRFSHDTDHLLFFQAMLTSEEEISAWLDFGEVPLAKVGFIYS